MGPILCPEWTVNAEFWFPSDLLVASLDTEHWINRCGVSERNSTLSPRVTVCSAQESVVVFRQWLANLPRQLPMGLTAGQSLGLTGRPVASTPKGMPGLWLSGTIPEGLSVH